MTKYDQMTSERMAKEFRRVERVSRIFGLRHHIAVRRKSVLAAADQLEAAALEIRQLRAEASARPASADELRVVIARWITDRYVKPDDASDMAAMIRDDIANGKCRPIEFPVSERTEVYRLRLDVNAKSCAISRVEERAQLMERRIADLEGILQNVRDRAEARRRYGEDD